MYPELADDITIYIKPKSKSKKGENEGPNAFAAGRKTICVTEDMLSEPEDQIKAVLAHEFGHLAHHDTDIVLVVTVGNLIITAIVTVVIAIAAFMRLVFSIRSGGEDAAPAALGFLMTSLFILIVNLLNRGWSQIGVWLCMKASRAHEYLADEFSFKLGYGVPDRFIWNFWRASRQFMRYVLFEYIMDL